MVIGEKYEVVVTKILEKGIVVTMQPDQKVTEFIHISKISSDYVRSVNDYVTIGDKYIATAVAGTSRTELSLTDLNLKSKQLSTYQRQDVKLTNQFASKRPTSNSRKSSNQGELSIDEMIKLSNLRYEETRASLESRYKRRRKHS